jgi:hypothetical protein
MSNNYNYIPTHIGTFPISIYDRIREIVTPILKKHHVGLRGRGRGRRVGHPMIKDWNGNPYKPNYQAYLPRNLSDKVGCYIRVEPTQKFLQRNSKRPSDSKLSVVYNFQTMVCPLIVGEILSELKKNGIEPIKVKN